MPWCDPCSKYLAPNATTPQGACPTCNTVLATKGALQMEARSLGVPGPGQEEGETPKAPWHFKLLLLAIVIYLGWRGIQGVGWLMNKIG
jgi:hypothetical protein